MRAAHTSRQQGIGQQWVGPATLSPAPPQHRQDSKLTSGAASKGACLLGVNNDGGFVVFSFTFILLSLHLVCLCWMKRAFVPLGLICCAPPFWALFPFGHTISRRVRFWFRFHHLRTCLVSSPLVFSLPSSFLAAPLYFVLRCLPTLSPSITGTFSSLPRRLRLPRKRSRPLYLWTLRPLRPPVSSNHLYLLVYL
jgi:hypothetical protein